MAQNMKIIYTPEGASKQEWVIDLQNPAWDLTFATEKATDWPWATFVERIQNQSAIAMRALLWVLRKRTEPRLTLEAVVPNFDELDFAAQCSRCEAWFDTEDHSCLRADSDASDEPAEATPGEA